MAPTTCRGTRFGEVPSRGRSHRLNGVKTGRLHHLLSDNEANLFRLLDWSDDVLDIREQLPLDRQDTLRIAEQLAIRYPCDRKTQTPLVMTTDFLVDVLRNGRTVTLARAVKPHEELDKPRVIQKFEVERRLWVEQGVDWGIVTDRDLPMAVIANIIQVRGALFVDTLTQPYPGYYREKAALVLREAPARPTLSMRQFCAALDAQLEMPADTCLMLLRHLIATKAIRYDMSQPLDDSLPMRLFRPAESSAGWAVG